MKPETYNYILDEMLPNNEDEFYDYIKNYIDMFLDKIIRMKGVCIKDQASLEMEAMLLSTRIQIMLIDRCVEEEKKND